MIHLVAYPLVFIVGVILGGGASVIFWRRNMKRCEETLKKVEAIRDQIGAL